jgi:predicted ATPase
MLTLIGQGGIGKTRLSIQIGELSRENFEDGVYFVSLAPVTSAESLIGAIAESLRFGCIENDLKAELFDYLRLKQILLILDNFEHLLDHAELLTEILALSVTTKILVTSRERLNLREEWIYELDGLTFPFAEVPLDELPTYGAVALFMQAAKQIQPDFTLTAENAPHITRISQLVEGLPLGIELAAGWLQMLSPQEIAQEIQRSYDFLSASLRNLPPRHRSMKAVFESSWERLSSEEAHTLCRLAIFRGGFDRHAATQVANANLPILLALVNKSLIRRHVDGRYDIHELLRQFAEEKLAIDAHAYHQTKTHHSEYYATWLEAIDIQIKGAHQIETLNAIERDFSNIRASWSWVCEQKQADILHRLLNGIVIYFIMRSRDDEAYQLCGEALRHVSSDAPETKLLRSKLEVLWAMGNRGKQPKEVIAEKFHQLSAYFRSIPDQPHLVSTFFLMYSLSLYPGANLDMPAENIEPAQYWAKRAETIADRAGDTFGKIVALRGLGWVAHERIDYAESKRIFQQTLALSQHNQDTWNEGESVKTLAEVAYTLGEYPLAEELTYQGLLISEKVGDRGGIASALSALSSTFFRQGKYEESEIITQKSIALWRDLGNVGMVGWQLHLLGELDRIRGNYSEAVYHFADARELHLRTQSRLGNGWCSCASAWLEFLHGNLDSAMQFLNQAQLIFERNSHIWGYVTVDNHRAEIACSQGDFETARRLIDCAIENAEKCQSIMFQTRNWVTLARILGESGDKRGALIWLEKAIAHHATWADVRERAIQLRTDYLVVLARG